MRSTARCETGRHKLYEYDVADVLAGSAARTGGKGAAARKKGIEATETIERFGTYMAGYSELGLRASQRWLSRPDDANSY